MYSYLIKNSDINLNENGAEATRVFFNNSYLGFFESNQYYDGLGSPIDEVGDGVAETIFEIDGKIYTVDGITNPRSTKNFPDWVNDPAVKQYFWDPTNVGCLWDANNPDEFPEP